MASKRPFHETIVDVINRCPKDNLAILLELLVNTEIPANKDAIVNALKIKRAIKIRIIKPWITQSNAF